MELEAFIVDAFSDGPGRGNPAGVVLCREGLGEALMQTIAFEMGRSETAFVRMDSPGGPYAIRWFSPIKEVSLCGHATMAAARVLLDGTEAGSIEFLYAGGALRADRSGEDGIAMDFPLDGYAPTPLEPEYREFFGELPVTDCIRGTGTGKVVLILDGSADLVSVRPDFTRMRAYEGICTRGIGLSRPSKAYDFETRYFNPWFGVDEDPVTGSVHTLLAAYWGERLGKRRLRARQVSHRPGELILETRGDRVSIEGRARIFFRGMISV